MFQFNSSPLQLNIDYNIPDATRRKEYNKETVAANSSSSFSDIVYNYNTNASFSSFDSGVGLFGMGGLPSGSQLYPIEQPTGYPVDCLNTVHHNAPESSSSATLHLPNLPTLTPEGEQCIDTRLLNMPFEVSQPPFSLSTDGISPAVSNQWTPPIPTAFEQECVDTHSNSMQYATVGTPLMDYSSPVHLKQPPTYETTGELFGEYSMGRRPALAPSNRGGATMYTSHSLNNFIATYPNTSVLYGVMAPGQAPAIAVPSTASTSTRVVSPPSAPAVALPAPAPKSAKKHSRPRKTKSSSSRTRKNVKASAPTSKVPCLFPGCNRLFYDEKTRQRHASTHDEARPGFFCPGMYIPRMGCARCNCRETGYTREDALVRHLKSIEPYNPCVLEAERLGWSADVKGSAMNLRGYRPVKPVIANIDAGAEP